MCGSASTLGRWRNRDAHGWVAHDCVLLEQRWVEWEGGEGGINGDVVAGTCGGALVVRVGSVVAGSVGEREASHVAWPPGDRGGCSRDREGMFVVDVDGDLGFTCLDSKQPSIRQPAYGVGIPRLVPRISPG